MNRFSVGSRVRIVGAQEGVVIEVEDQVSPPSYRIFISALATPLVSEPDLELIEATESDLVALLRRGVFASLSEFRFALTQRRLSDQLTDTLLTYNAARIQIQAHQFKPLLKLLGSPYRRLLIADEVGLGKTIEAGIILGELDLRERFERVLIVCPHALTYKWRDELDAKFGMRFAIWSAGDAKQWLQEATRDGYAAPIRAIASLESLRGADVLTLLEGAPVALDFLIVDEAHHLRNDDTSSFALGEGLTDSADIVLFLSATPLNLATKDLFSLVRLLVPDVYGNEETFQAQLAPNQSLNAAIRLLRNGSPNVDVLRALAPVLRGGMAGAFTSSERLRELMTRLADPAPLTREERVLAQRVCMDLNTLDSVLTRTRKTEVASFAVRAPHSLVMRFSPAERAFYDAVTAFCLERYSVSGGAGFGAVTYQRQVCSCIPAMRELLHGIQAGRRATAEEDEEDDEPQRGLSEAEAALLEDAIAAGMLVGEQDTKFERLSMLLDELLGSGNVERVMLFSFFRGTIRYLQRRLSGRFRVGVIMGGMSLEEREQEVQAFRQGRVQVLLASEVGGEGLDFQFCNVLVNYDLPWNPMRVEQRIGRLDRFGQQNERILIYNLLVEDSVEARIFGRLFERIDLFSATIGDLEAILGETVSELTRAAMDLRLTPAEQARKAELLAQQLIHRKRHDEDLSRHADSLLSSDQYHLDRFRDIQAGRSFVTGGELENFMREALARYFPDSQLNSSGSRVWLRPDARFAEFLRQEVYEAGADGHLHRAGLAMRPLLRLRAAADRAQAVEVTFDPDRGFDDKALELLSPSHPYVQGLARLATKEPLNRFSVASLRLSGNDLLRPGRYLVVLYKLQATGLRPMRRLEAITVELASTAPGRLPPGQLGLLLESVTEDRNASGIASAALIDAASRAAEQLLIDLKEDERAELEARQGDLLRLRSASLQFAFERKEERLLRAIASIRSPEIKRLRQGQLRNARTRHENQLEQLRGLDRVGLTYDRIAAALLTVSA